MNQDKNGYNSWIKLVLMMSIFGYVTVNFATFALLLFPVWFMMDSINHGIFHGSSAMVATCALLMYTTSSQVAIFILLLFLPVVIIFHYLVHAQKSYRTTLVVLALVFMLSFLSLFASTFDIGSIMLSKPDTLNEIGSSLMSEEMTRLEIKQINDSLNNSWNTIITIFPSLIIIVSLVFAYMNYTIVGRFLISYGVLISQPPFFYKFKLPSSIVMGTIISFLSISILKNQLEELYGVIMLNLAVLFGFLYLVQGFSVLNYATIRIGVNSVVRVLLYIVVLTMVSFYPILVSIGFVDSVFNFRKVS
ncbi:MAG: DUF2232 domain-containing protein [Tissierellia bacterium]|nr:DUF2232 domain-containing protein [Tissierellia bacterium]